jgi:hypothetical protein
MINEDPGLVAGVRQAIEDLTATVSDFEGDSVGLAAERWSSSVDRVVERGAAGGAELGLLLNGYRQLALKLVVELARAKDVSPQGCDARGWQVDGAHRLSRCPVAGGSSRTN